MINAICKIWFVLMLFIFAPFIIMYWGVLVALLLVLPILPFVEDQEAFLSKPEPFPGFTILAIGVSIGSGLWILYKIKFWSGLMHLLSEDENEDKADR